MEKIEDEVREIENYIDFQTLKLKESLNNTVNIQALYSKMQEKFMGYFSRRMKEKDNSMTSINNQSGSKRNMQVNMSSIKDGIVHVESRPTVQKEISPIRNMQQTRPNMIDTFDISGI